MVMFSAWQRTPLDPGIPSDLPMNGESTDLGASAPDPAGYLGKVNERASLVENCPWCSAKGQTYGLRSYRINFHESITLCTNSECLFPLVSRPLEDVLNSLTPAPCKDGGKRRSPSGEDSMAFSKRHKAEHPEGAAGLMGDAGVSQEAVSFDGNGEHAEAGACLPGEGADGHAVPETHALPLQDRLLAGADGCPGHGELLPSDPLSDPDEMESGNGEEIEPLCDRVPAVEEEVRPMAELELELELDLEMGPMAEPEGSLPEQQAENLAEDEEDFPTEEPEVRLVGEVKVGPAVKEEVRPMAEPEEIPKEQAANRTVERKVGPAAEQVVRPTVEQVASPAVEQVVRPTVEQVVRPTVEQVVRPTVEQVASPAVEQVVGPAGMLPAPPHLFWKNENNLCWLDALLVALVHCQTLRRRAASLLKNRSPIQRLCNSYSQVCDRVDAHKQTVPEDNIVRVPSTVHGQVMSEMQDLRMSVFMSLQPKLKCNLGQEETPVFALPVLLRLDSHAEALFQHTFHWDFECADCGHTSRSRCQKTLTTFTGVLPDWHPLSAIHQATCNQCLRKLQNRKMVLKSISPVFALHFVEGLPHNNVDEYSFEFHSKHYFVSTVIQYDQRLKHFATWIRDDAGSWLEFDDLKYPQCTSHKSLPVPANQIHMVFWEAQSGKLEGPCSGGRYQRSAPTETETGEADAREQDHSLAIPQDDTYIMEALTEDSKVSPNGPDSSVGSTTLLEAFEGLSHSDIVTLTLVEVKVDAEGRTLADSEPPVAVETSPVSSSRANGCGTPRRQRGKRGPRTAPRGTPEKAVQPDGGAINPPVSNSPPSAPDPPSPTPDPPSPVSKAPTPSAFAAARWSTLLSRHPSYQSTPVIPKHVSPTLSYKPALKLATDDGIPDRAAEMFRGFHAGAFSVVNNESSDRDRCLRGEDSRTKNEAFKQPWLKSACPQPSANNLPPLSLKPSRTTEVLSLTTRLGPAKSLKTPTSMALSDTSTLRRKLLKKLKKKKQLLAALDCVMGKEAPDSLQRPDSTEISSPYAVSSTTSQCSSSGYDEFLNDLLSPSTTASNLSPDSTGLLEMLVTGQDGAQAGGGNPAAPRPGGRGSDWNSPTPAENLSSSAKDDFLEEFMSGAELPPSHTPENVDFNIFDMFF